MNASGFLALWVECREVSETKTTGFAAANGSYCRAPGRHSEPIGRGIPFLRAAITPHGKDTLSRDAVAT